MNINGNIDCTDNIPIEICDRYYIFYLTYGFILALSTIKNNPAYYLIILIIVNLIDIVIDNNNIDILSLNLYLILGTITFLIYYAIIFFNNKTTDVEGLKELIKNNWIFKSQENDDNNNNNNNDDNNITTKIIVNLKLIIIIIINYIISYFLFLTSNLVYEELFIEGLLITYFLILIQYSISYIILSPNLNSFNINSFIEKKNLLSFQIWFLLISLNTSHFLVGLFLQSNLFRVLISFLIQFILSFIIKFIFF